MQPAKQLGVRPAMQLAKQRHWCSRPRRQGSPQQLGSRRTARKAGRKMTQTMGMLQRI